MLHVGTAGFSFISAVVRENGSFWDWCFGFWEFFLYSETISVTAYSFKFENSGVAAEALLCCET